MEGINIDQLTEHLFNHRPFVTRLKNIVKLNQESSKSKDTLDHLIEEVQELLHDLIRQQLENELKEIIQDNNRILMEIKDSMIKSSSEKPVHEINEEDISFSQVHRLMDEERKKLDIPESVNDASLQRSVSAFVELKMETIEEKVAYIDKKLKSIQDKYQTNLKSIWNVLSITEGAIFDHLKESRKSCICKTTSSITEPQKKSFFGSLFK